MTTILFVEDHDDTRELICELLEGSGYDVKGVGSAECAIEELRGGRYDLVVTDHWLDPGETGAWLLHQMAREGIELPAVMCTAERLPPNVPEGVTIVKKPVDVELLLREIEQARSAFVAARAAKVAAVAPETEPANDVRFAATRSGVITRDPRSSLIDLVLYITRSQASMRGLRNVRRVLDAYGASNVELEVIDVTDPRRLDELALAGDRVAFTPMLVKRGPGARERLVGDFADTSPLEDLLDRLGIERSVCVA